MEEKQIQIPDVNADAEERDNYTLIQETPEDNLPGENGIASVTARTSISCRPTSCCGASSPI